MTKRRSKRSRERESLNGWRLDLGGAILKRADLWYAYLGEADLRGVHLEAADLRDAHFGGSITEISGLDEALEFKFRLAVAAAQLAEAYGDSATQLSADVARPAHWPEAHPR